MIGIFTSQQPREDTNRTRPPLGAVHSSMAAAPQRLHASKLLRSPLMLVSMARSTAGVSRAALRGEPLAGSWLRWPAILPPVLAVSGERRGTRRHRGWARRLRVRLREERRSERPSLQHPRPLPSCRRLATEAGAASASPALQLRVMPVPRPHAGSPAVTARQAHSGTHVVTSPLHRARPGVRCACHARLTGSIYPYSADTRLTFTEERTMCLTCSIAASALRLL